MEMDRWVFFIVENYPMNNDMNLMLLKVSHINFYVNFITITKIEAKIQQNIFFLVKFNLVVNYLYNINTKICINK